MYWQPYTTKGAVGGTLVDLIGFRRASVLSDAASSLVVIAIPTLFLTLFGFDDLEGR